MFLIIRGYLIRSTREKYRYSSWQKFSRILALRTASQMNRIFCSSHPSKMMFSRPPVRYIRKRLLISTTQVRQKVSRPMATLYLTELLQKMKSPFLGRMLPSVSLRILVVLSQKYSPQFWLVRKMVWLFSYPGRGLQKLVISSVSLLEWIALYRSSSYLVLRILLPHSMVDSPPYFSVTLAISFSQNWWLASRRQVFLMCCDSCRTAGSESMKTWSGQLLASILQRLARSKRPSIFLLQPSKDQSLMMVVWEVSKKLQEMCLSMVSWNLKEAARMLSWTAKGLKLEYMMMGEKTSPRMNKKPGGPMKYLYQGPLPRGLVLSISDSHLDWYILALMSSNFIQWKSGRAVAVMVQSEIFLNSQRKGMPVKSRQTQQSTQSQLSMRVLRHLLRLKPCLICNPEITKQTRQSIRKMDRKVQDLPQTVFSHSGMMLLLSPPDGMQKYTKKLMATSSSRWNTYLMINRQSNLLSRLSSSSLRGWYLSSLAKAVLMKKFSSFWLRASMRLSETMMRSATMMSAWKKSARIMFLENWVTVSISPRDFLLFLDQNSIMSQKKKMYSRITTCTIASSGQRSFPGFSLPFANTRWKKLCLVEQRSREYTLRNSASFCLCSPLAAWLRRVRQKASQMLQRCEQAICEVPPNLRKTISTTQAKMMMNSQRQSLGWQQKRKLMKKCFGRQASSSLQLRIAEEYSSRNTQKNTVVFVYSTIAQAKIAMLVGIVQTPPKKFHPAVMIRPIISMFCTIFLVSQLSSPSLRSILSLQQSFELPASSLALLLKESISWSYTSRFPWPCPLFSDSLNFSERSLSSTISLLESTASSSAFSISSSIFSRFANFSSLVRAAYLVCSHFLSVSLKECSQCVRTHCLSSKVVVVKSQSMPNYTLQYWLRCRQQYWRSSMLMKVSMLENTSNSYFLNTVFWSSSPSIFYRFSKRDLRCEHFSFSSCDKCSTFMPKFSL